MNDSVIEGLLERNALEAAKSRTLAVGRVVLPEAEVAEIVPVIYDWADEDKDDYQ